MSRIAPEFSTERIFDRCMFLAERTFDKSSFSAEKTFDSSRFSAKKILNDDDDEEEDGDDEEEEEDLKSTDIKIMSAPQLKHLIVLALRELLTGVDFYQREPLTYVWVFSRENF